MHDTGKLLFLEVSNKKSSLYFIRYDVVIPSSSVKYFYTWSHLSIKGNGYKKDRLILGSQCNLVALKRQADII